MVSSMAARRRNSRPMARPQLKSRRSINGYVVLWTCPHAGMTERRRDDMPNRPSLFKPKPADTAPDPGGAPAMIGGRNGRAESKQPPSREAKRVLSVYLDPLAWKQLRMLALD